VRHYMCHKQISQILNSKKPGQIHFEALWGTFRTIPIQA
jgi:hypothetical protein